MIHELKLYDLVGFSTVKCSYYYQFFFLRFYLFTFSVWGREGETSMCVGLSHTPNWGPGPQPRHVPWLGIKPATLGFADWHSIHWATPARAQFYFLKIDWLIFRKGKGGRKRRRETSVVASCIPRSRDLAHNPGVCLDNPPSHASQGTTVNSRTLLLIPQNSVH